MMTETTLRDQDELEELRSSVRRLREQREAVEKLKDFALAKERQADSLAERLRSIDGRRHDSDACAAEKARLERTLVDLRERFESQAHLVIELERNLKQYHEERKEMKEKLHSESCRNEALVEVHRKEVLELRDLLTEARETYQLRENSRVSLVDQLRREREELLFMRGELEERVRELVQEQERHRMAAVVSGETLNLIKEENRALQTRIQDLMLTLENAQEKLSETARDDNMSHQLKDDNLQLSAHLKEARANAEMLRETCAAKDGTIRSLTTDIQELQDQVGVLTRKHQAFHDAEETIADLRNQLERERRERSSLSRARAQLLNQLSDEEHKLYQVLGTGAAGSIAGINDGNDC